MPSAMPPNMSPLSSTASSVSVASLASPQSVCSTGSISTVADNIGRDARPRLLQPGLPTPTWPNDQGILSMTCSGSIRAPLPLIVAILLDSRTYPLWNVFCPRCTITHQPNSTAPLPSLVAGYPAVEAVANLPSTLRDGTCFNMEFTMGLPEDATAGAGQGKGRTSPTMQISCIESFQREDGRVGIRIAWYVKGRITSFFMRTERVQEIIPSVEDPDFMDFACWETYYGLCSPAIKPFWKHLEAGYAAWVNGLKQFAEDKALAIKAVDEVISDME